MYESYIMWKEVKEGEEARKHGTYSGTKRSIAELWFLVDANCFVKCICTRHLPEF
jgi:hypothetical protein